MVIFQFAMLVYKRVNTSNLQPIHFRHGWRVPSGQKHNRRRRSRFNPANWTCGALYFAVPRCLDADRCQQISMISWLCLTDGSLWMFCWTLFSWYSEIFWTQKHTKSVPTLHLNHQSSLIYPMCKTKNKIMNILKLLVLVPCFFIVSSSLK